MTAPPPDVGAEGVGLQNLQNEATWAPGFSAPVFRPQFSLRIHGKMVYLPTFMADFYGKCR